MIVIRCSETDRFLACPSSVAPCDAPYRPESDAASAGRAGHAALAWIVDHGTDPDLDAIARTHGVDRDDLWIVVAMARKLMPSLTPLFPRGKAEVPLEDELDEGIILRGTADVVSSAPDGDGHLAILDWKLGYAPTDHVGQIKSYALLAWLGVTPSMRPDDVLAIEAHVRTGEIRTHRFTRAELEDHHEAIIVAAGRVNRAYGPSADACRFCPRQHDCRARDQWMRGVASVLGEAQPQALSRDVLGSLYERSRVLYAALRAYDAALDAALEQGPVPLGDGRHVVVDEVEQQKIRTSKAMPYLRESLGLTADEADACITIAKTGLERVVKARAEKGKGAAMIRETITALQERGAVEVETVRRKKIEQQPTPKETAK